MKAVIKSVCYEMNMVGKMYKQKEMIHTIIPQMLFYTWYQVSETLSVCEIICIVYFWI